MKKIEVLDHGYVGLVDVMGNDLSVVRAARVSYDAEWRTGEDEGKDEKLIRYLMKNRHTSPFEAVTFTFDIRCPIFVARQWHRHRTWAYNEVSARYTELPDDFYVPDPALIGVQAAGNKQMREVDGQATAHSRAVADFIRNASQHAHAAYKDLIQKGCPRELARLVLPMGTYTHFFGVVNLHNLFHFLRLRLHPHAQHEIRVYAEAMLDLIEEHVPVSVAAFKETL